MKILTIGTSIITSHFIDAVSKSNHSKIKAIYSRDMSKAIALAYPLGALAFDDLEKALASEEIDTVYVASVNSLHFQHASIAIKAKKHVILEKPVTSNEKEFKALLELAHTHQVFCLEAITTLHLPNYHWIKSHLPKLGNIKHVYASYHQHSSKYQAYLHHENPNVFNLEMSGGCLVDLNVYNLHFILSLWNQPKQAWYHPKLGHNGVDVSGLAIFDFGAFKAIASASKTHDGVHRLFIEGEHGHIEVISAANRIKQATLVMGKETITSPIDDENNVLTYEVKVFEEIIQNNDIQKVSELNQTSLDVITWMSNMRRNAHVWFKGENDETFF